jgi:hypothetical protein
MVVLSCRLQKVAMSSFVFVGSSSRENGPMYRTTLSQTKSKAMFAHHAMSPNASLKID